MGVLSSDLRPRAQCIQARNRANRALGFISRSVSNRSAEVFLKLYLALARPHLDYTVQFWSPSYRIVRIVRIGAEEDDKHDSGVQKLAIRGKTQIVEFAFSRKAKGAGRYDRGF